jgi:hypothetical protein
MCTLNVAFAAKDAADNYLQRNSKMKSAWKQIQIEIPVRKDTTHAPGLHIYINRTWIAAPAAGNEHYSDDHGIPWIFPPTTTAENFNLVSHSRDLSVLLAVPNRQDQS